MEHGAASGPRRTTTEIRTSHQESTDKSRAFAKLNLYISHPPYPVCIRTSFAPRTRLGLSGGSGLAQFFLFGFLLAVRNDALGLL